MNGILLVYECKSMQNIFHDTFAPFPGREGGVQGENIRQEDAQLLPMYVSQLSVDERPQISVVAKEGAQVRALRKYSLQPQVVVEFVFLQNHHFELLLNGT